jgi:hypothetical protein
MEASISMTTVFTSPDLMVRTNRILFSERGRSSQGNTQLFGDHAQHVGRLHQDVVDVPGSDLYLVTNPLLLRLGQLALLHQGIYIEAIPLIGGHATRRGIGLVKKAQTLQIVQDAANAGRTDAQPAMPGQVG